MAVVSGLSALRTNFSGPIHPKLPLTFHNYKKNGPENRYAIQMAHKMTPRSRIGFLNAKDSGIKSAISVGRNHELCFDNDVRQEPFWLTFVKKALLSLKSLFRFLREQPSQLKYIEWPTFLSTLKTASLTLVLVALLIVALASVDSALSYMLALVLRTTP